MSGWDYNLTKKCIKTTQPSNPHYYEDVQQCSAYGNWTLAVQSERVSGQSCPGPNTQSFPINTPSSPISLGWMPHTDEYGSPNWTVNLKTDLCSIVHQCGAGYFTWAMFMDHVGHGGGPLPSPENVQFSATVNFNDYVPDGATRAIALYQGWWNGKARLIELSFQSSNWGDNLPGNPAIFDYRDDPDLTFIGLEGAHYGLQVPKGADTVITVPWNSIIESLIASGHLPRQVGGWVSVAVGLGHEIKNETSGPGAVADLWFTNFRVY